MSDDVVMQLEPIDLEYHRMTDDKVYCQNTDYKKHKLESLSSALTLVPMEGYAEIKVIDLQDIVDYAIDAAKAGIRSSRGMRNEEFWKNLGKEVVYRDG